MAVKTFTTGEVLTASDTNTYLNNGGLVYITSATVGTAVSSVTVSNVFSSTYENYRIIYTGGTLSAASQITFQLGSSTTGYYGGLSRVDTAAAASNIAMNNTAAWTYSGIGDGDGALLEMEVFQPYTTFYTRAKLSWIDLRTTNAWGMGGGVHRVAASYSSFTIGYQVGVTATGGTIRVYGYRQA